MQAGPPLGVVIEGGTDTDRGSHGVRIAGIREGGAASQDGTMRVGDELLLVDDDGLYECSHDEAVQTLVEHLKGASPTLTLTLARENLEALGDLEDFLTAAEDEQEDDASGS